MTDAKYVFIYYTFWLIYIHEIFENIKSRKNSLNRLYVASGKKCQEHSLSLKSMQSYNLLYIWSATLR